MAPHLTTLPKEVVANHPDAPWRSSELKPKVADMNANDFPTISSSIAEIHSYGSDNQTAGAAAQIHSYAELQQRIHDDLRVQHPEWVKSNGDCPTCDAYERRLAELIGLFQSSERKLAAA